MCYNATMDFSHPTNVQSKPRGKKRHPLRLILLIFAGLLLTALILIAAAPTLLSLAPVRGMLLDAANRHLAPSAIRVESWSFSWFGEQTVSGLSYSDPEAGVGVQVASATLGSLWSLLPIGRIEAAVTVDTPAVTYRPQPYTQPPPPAVMPDGGDTSESSLMLPAWDLGLTVVIRSGSFRMYPHPEPLLSDADLTLTVPSLDAPCSLQATARILEAQMRCAVDTASVRTLLSRPLPLPETASLSLEAPWGQADLRITSDPLTLPLPRAALAADIDLGMLYARTQAYGIPLPLSDVAGKTRLNAALSPTSSDTADAELVVTLSGMRATRDGTVLRCDGPLTLSAKARCDGAAAFPIPGTGSGLPLSSLTAAVGAPWGDLRLSALPSETGSAIPKADLGLRLNLPALQHFAAGFGTFPKGLALERGELSGTLSVTPHDAATADIVLTLRSKDVRSTWDGKALNVSPNVDLSARLDTRTPLASEIRRLSVEFPGLLASGSGSLRKGRLAAALDVRELMGLTAPFTGLAPVDKPLSVTLNITSDAQVLNLTAQAKSERARLADVALRVTGLDAEAKRFGEADLKSDFDLGALLRFYPVAGLPLRAAEARLLLNATASGGADGIRARTLFALRDADLGTTAWHVKESELLAGSADVCYADNRISLPSLKLKSPVFTAEGSVTSAVPLKASLKGTLTPERVFSAWRQWGRDETPFALTGSVRYAVAADQPLLSLEADSADLTFTRPPWSGIPFPFACTAAAALGCPGGSDVRLDRLTFAGPYADLTAAGVFRDGCLTLDGELAPDMAAIRALPFFEGLSPRITLSGKAARPFSLDAPVTDGLPGIVNYGKARASVFAEHVGIPGLDISGAVLTATLDNALLALDGEAQLNGGTLRVTPRIALGMPPYTVTLPDNTAVIDGFRLTREMLDTGLCYILPLLAGSASSSGTFSLTARQFSMRLDDDPLASLKADLLFTTDNVSVAPDGLLGHILAMLRLRERAAYLPDQHLPITVRDAKLTTGELSMRIAALKLRCAGSTDLRTGAIDYALTVPLTEQLIGERASRYIGTQSLSIPIGGSVHRPTADTSVIGKILGTAVDNAVTREIGKQLDRLFDTAPASPDSAEEESGAAEAIRGGAEAIFDFIR